MNRGATANLILGAVIALLPLYLRVAPFQFDRISKDNLLVFIFFIVGAFLGDRKRSAPCLMVIAMVYGIVSLALNQWAVHSLNVMFQAVYIASGIVFFWHYFEKHSRGSLDFILNGMSVGCIIQCLLSIAEIFGIFNYQDVVLFFAPGAKAIRLDPVGIGHLAGSLGYKNCLAAYLGLTGISLFRRGWWGFVPVAVFCLLGADSIMGSAAFCAGAAYLLNSKFNIIKKIWIYLISILAMITIVFTGLSGADSMRFRAWKYMLSGVDGWHFLFGKGPGWFPDMGMILEDKTTMAQEHNEFLSAFNIFGIIGLALLLPIFIRFIKQDDERPIFAAILFAGFINSYGHFSLHQSTTAIIIIVAAAVCLAQRDRYVFSFER